LRQRHISSGTFRIPIVLWVETIRIPRVEGCGPLVKANSYSYSFISTKVDKTQRRVPELIPVLCSQPAGDVGHKPGGRLPLLSARPAVTLATLKRVSTNFAAW